MSDIKNLAGSPAVKKLKELAEGIDVCMFCTHLGELPITTRPMSTQEVDEQGNIWFFSRVSSNKNQEIKQDDKVQLFYAKITSSTYLSVFGYADVLVDKEKIKELWDGVEKAWFTEGKDDPEITLIRIRTQEAYYWDTKDGAVISLIKMGVAAITGQEQDQGVEGTLKP
jgi:general stress protein 26